MDDADDNGRLTRRARQISWAGMLIVLMGGGAAILPLIEWVAGSFLIGILLVAGGLIEMFAGALRRPTPYLALSAGGATSLAGLLFLIDPVAQFTPVIYIVIAWLVLRALLQALSASQSAPRVRFWTLVSAATDLILALLLLAGLSIATIVVLFFGPTPEFVASFAWVLALSFLGTGLMLINVANCERRLSSE